MNECVFPPRTTIGMLIRVQIYMQSYLSMCDASRSIVFSFFFYIKPFMMGTKIVLFIEDTERRPPKGIIRRK